MKFTIEIYKGNKKKRKVNYDNINKLLFNFEDRELGIDNDFIRIPDDECWIILDEEERTYFEEVKPRGKELENDSNR